MSISFRDDFHIQQKSVKTTNSTENRNTYHRNVCHVPTGFT